MKKICELCKYPATLSCESENVSLCWNCDALVHSANFLAARHSRTLLCRLCQSPTPWTATGPKLAATFSVCQRCVSRENDIVNRKSTDDDENSDKDFAPPPSSSSSSCSCGFGDDELEVVESASLKRRRENIADLDSEDASPAILVAQSSVDGGDSISTETFVPSKRRKTGQSESTSSQLEIGDNFPVTAEFPAGRHRLRLGFASD